MTRQPNFLLILVDEQRAPRPYDPPQALPAQQRLAARGLSLHRHYTASTACAPSRTTLFTGHYPSLHGVTQTDGLAKDASEVRWLTPGSLPTLGHMLRAAGYQTHYRGKWHISHADLLDEHHKSIPTNDKQGNLLADHIAAYKAADPLAPFGFSGWIGPEPHGADPANTGFVRDRLFADQAIDLLGQLGAQPRGEQPPFLLVASLVNPHDIAVYSGLWNRLWGFPWPDETLPELPPPPTADEDLATKPRCQKDYVDKYWRILLRQLPTARYRRFYFWLQQLVDVQVGRICDALQAAGLAEDTIVIFTSDHGDLLGAHGGMHQKWHNAYEETLRVPLIFSNPRLFPGPQVSTQLTSHVDLLPTVLSLAGVDQAAVLQQLRSSHATVVPPVGRDLSALLRQPARAAPPAPAEEVVYFMTDDQISDGGSWLEFGRLMLPYRPVIQPAYVETVVARLRSDPRTWKLSRYFDGKQGLKADEFELYCLDDDPLERQNLANLVHVTDKSLHIRAQLEGLLERCRRERRLSAAPAATSGQDPAR
jgi:arylsulfatase A-like enzyme